MARGLRIEIDSAAEISESTIAQFVAHIGAVADANDLPHLSGRLTVTSELPIGSGFGSSAALCTAIARLLMRDYRDDHRTWRIAHELERFFHGTPSGIDTGLTTLGGARAFRFDRSIDHAALPATVAVDLPHCVLTVGSIPRERSTKELVAHVGERRRADPQAIDSMLAQLGALGEAVAQEDGSRGGSTRGDGTRGGSTRGDGTRGGSSRGGRAPGREDATDSGQTAPSRDATDSGQTAPSRDAVDSGQAPPSRDAVDSTQVPPSRDAVDSTQVPPSRDAVDSTQVPPSRDAVVSFGRAASDAHGILRELGVSTQKLDEILRIGTEAGALGGKLSGAGGGGAFFLVSAEEDGAFRVLQAIEPAVAQAGGIVFPLATHSS
jgi:mevalonate kinase